MKYEDFCYVPYIESHIENTPELAEYIFNTSKDSLKIGDIVYCSFFKHLHKIEKIGHSDKILISSIIDKTQSYAVQAKFLKPYEGSVQAIKVLYNP